MQVRNLFYHTGCFRCSACDCLLSKGRNVCSRENQDMFKCVFAGDEFCLKDEFTLLCKAHLEMMNKSVIISENDPGRKRAKSFGEWEQRI